MKIPILATAILVVTAFAPLATAAPNVEPPAVEYPGEASTLQTCTTVTNCALMLVCFVNPTCDPLKVKFSSGSDGSIVETVLCLVDPRCDPIVIEPVLRRVKAVVDYAVCLADPTCDPLFLELLRDGDTNLKIVA